jgi:signal transduction histidine kinase
MSLRGTITVSVLLLAALALSAASALVGLSSAFERTASGLAVAVESVRLTERMEVDLLASPRLDRQAFERRLRNELAEAGRYTETKVEQDLLAAARAHLQAFFDEVDRGGGADLSPAAQRELQAARTALDGLVQVNVAQAQEAQAGAERATALASGLGVGVSAALLLGVLAVLLWLQRVALRPLFAIREQMERFGRGERGARAPVSGPAELREVAQQFNEMADSLQRQRERQLAFLAGVAHDLRNPLSAIKLSVPLLKAAARAPERGQQALEVLDRQVEHLDRMAGDLLDETRIEIGQFSLHRQRLDLREVARAAGDLFASASSRHPVKVELPTEPVEVQGDPVRLGQVVNNLVSNAIKYSPAGGTVSVSVGRQGAEATLSVSDQGMGIPSEELGAIFEPFHRTAQARQNSPGVGLGLSVSRSIVEAHGGRIEVSSRPGVGSVFRVVLPL